MNPNISSSTLLKSLFLVALGVGCFISVYGRGIDDPKEITFQVGCFAEGCFTRIDFVKSIKSEFPICTKAPDQIVATVEIGCGCTVQQVESFL